MKDHANMMKYYYAPMEGITGHVYRRAHHSLFPGVDKYYTPFVTATHTRSFKQKEKYDVAPENNEGIPVVPQILTRDPEDFLWAASYMADLGYREVNLNLGCPVGTVVKHGRGAGMLSDPENLDRFFDAVLGRWDQAGLSGVKLSVKTRLGMTEPSEWERLFAVYASYPLSEITVHARTREDAYRGVPRLDVYGEILEKYPSLPLVYNGNLFTKEDLALVKDRFPGTETVMLGRGLVADPALVRELRGGEPLGKKELRAFHDRLYADLSETMPGTAVVIGKMKEYWVHMGAMFPESAKQLKAVYKARTKVEYEGAVRVLFNTGRLAERKRSLY